MKINFPFLFCGIFSLVFLASCNSGNKVVSSFGKRKYTKGYYFNFAVHKKNESNVTSAKLVPLKNSNAGMDIKRGNSRTFQTVPLAEKVITANAARKKINLLYENRSVIAKPGLVVSSKNSENICVSKNYIIDDGIPGHGGITEAKKPNRFDGDALAGFILGLLCIVFSFTGIGLVLSIPGIIFSSIGLKSNKRHALAVVGLVLSIIGLVALLILIAIFIIILSLI